MHPLIPDYLTEIARQLGSLSAFLGGFAAAFLGTLLTMASPRRTTSWAIASAAFAAVAFILVVVASTKLVILLHPKAPTAGSLESLGGTRVVMGLGFLLGTYALLLSIGLSGWLRSRRMGLLTSLLAGIAAVLISGLLITL